jgi:hypothetical protein
LDSLNLTPEKYDICISIVVVNIAGIGKISQLRNISNCCDIHSISKNLVNIAGIGKISQLRNISNCCDIHSISKNQYQVILARYHLAPR